jgi:hypothetical protein
MTSLCKQHIKSNKMQPLLKLGHYHILSTPFLKTLFEKWVSKFQKHLFKIFMKEIYVIFIKIQHRSNNKLHLVQTVLLNSATCFILPSSP